MTDAAGIPEPSAEVVRVADLRAHPQNYRGHPPDELAHLEQSIREHGVYKNIVIARDGTVLAGHGVWEAAKRLGLDEIRVVRLDVDPDDPRAIKVLTGDNEIGRLAEIDDRLLADHLRQLAALDELYGTGYDEKMLANLVMVTRPASEIADLDAAAHWVGLPSFEPDDTPREKLTMQFATVEDRDEFVRQLGLHVVRGPSAWWPPRRSEDADRSLEFRDERGVAFRDGDRIDVR